MLIQDSSGSLETDDSYVTIQGEVPTIKIISDKRDLSVRRRRANVNFQITVALACLLYIHQFMHMLGYKVVVG